MKSPSIHLLLAFLACIAIIIGYGFWYAAVENKSAAAARLEKQIVVKTETTSRVASARASLAEIAGDEASMQNYFVSETGVVAFINNLEAQGKKLGATVDVLSVAASGGRASLDSARHDSAESGTQPTLTFSLSVKGSFDSIMRTVGAIEYAPYDLTISALSVGQDGKDGWHADLSLLVGSVMVNPAAKKP